MVMRENLVVVQESSTEPSALTGLTAYLEAAPVQDGMADGVEVTFGVVNRGTSVVSLFNPFDTVQFQLLDQAGFPLRLPTRPSGLRMVTSRGGTWRFIPPLPIVVARRNGEAVGLEAIGERVLTVGTPEECAVTFLIDRFLKEQPRQPDADDHPAEESLAAGVYRVRCVATLIRADDSQDARVLQAPAVEIRFAPRA